MVIPVQNCYVISEIIQLNFCKIYKSDKFLSILSFWLFHSTRHSLYLTHLWSWINIALSYLKSRLISVAFFIITNKKTWSLLSGSITIKSDIRLSWKLTRSERQNFMKPKERKSSVLEKRFFLISDLPSFQLYMTFIFCFELLKMRLFSVPTFRNVDIKNNIWHWFF